MVEETYDLSKTFAGIDGACVTRINYDFGRDPYPKISNAHLLEMRIFGFRICFGFRY